MSWATSLILDRHPAPPVLIARVVALPRSRGGRRRSPPAPTSPRRWADRHGLPPMRRAGDVAARLRGLRSRSPPRSRWLALARPQWGEVPEQIGVDASREVMIALDLSQQHDGRRRRRRPAWRAPSSLVAALLDALHGERVGLTVFCRHRVRAEPAQRRLRGAARVPRRARYRRTCRRAAPTTPSMLRAAARRLGAQGDGARYLVVAQRRRGASTRPGRGARPARCSEQRHPRHSGSASAHRRRALVPRSGDGGLVEGRIAAARGAVASSSPRRCKQLAEQTGGTYRDAATLGRHRRLVGATVATGPSAATTSSSARVRLAGPLTSGSAPALLLFLLLSYWLELPRFAPRPRSSHARPPSAPGLLRRSSRRRWSGSLAWQPPQAWRIAAAYGHFRSPSPSPPSPRPARPSRPDRRGAERAAVSSRVAGLRERWRTDTIAFAVAADMRRAMASRDGIIDDALAAVDRGEASQAVHGRRLSRRCAQQLEQLQHGPRTSRRSRTKTEGSADRSLGPAERLARRPKGGGLRDRRTTLQHEQRRRSDSAARIRQVVPISQEPDPNRGRGEQAKNEPGEAGWPVVAANERPTHRRIRAVRNGTDQHAGTDSEQTGSRGAESGTLTIRREAGGTAATRSQKNRGDEVKPADARPGSPTAPGWRRAAAAARRSGQDAEVRGPESRRAQDTRMVGGGRAMASAEPAAVRRLSPRRSAQHGRASRTATRRRCCSRPHEPRRGASRAPRKNGGTKNW